VVGELVLTPEEQAARRPGPGRDRAALLAMDEAGEPCACGTEQWQICLAHFGLTGHRRHVRPGQKVPTEHGQAAGQA
jgi:hypothetical protein